MRRVLKAVRVSIRPVADALRGGFYAAAIMFLLSNALNLGLSYMGNSDAGLVMMILTQFWDVILVAIGRLLLAYLVLGLVAGLWYALPARVLLDRRAKRKCAGSRALLVMCWTLLSVFVLLCARLVHYPQLFVDNFSSKLTVLASFQHLLTDLTNPYFFYVIFIALQLPSVVALGLRIPALWKALRRALAGRRRAMVPVLGLCLVLVIAAWGLRALLEHPAPKNAKNILIIASDAVRPDRFSCNGYSRQTPGIDRLAAESVQFRGVMTTVPRTFPSMVSILSSQYPLEHDVRHMFPRSRERYLPLETLPRVLSRQGYKTAVVSDFAGDIFPRIDLGFETTKAPDFTSTIMIRQVVLEKQVLLLPLLVNRLGMSLFPEMRGIAKFSLPDLLTDETVDEIDAAGNQPFMIMVFYSITHFPFSAPWPNYKMYADPDYDGPYRYYKQVVIQIGEGEGAAEGAPQGDGMTAADHQQVNDLYDGCLALFDKQVARLYEELEERGLLENTVVLLASDHGENLYEPGFGMGHGEHLRGDVALETSCIVRAPGIAPALRGTTTQRISSTIDIVPTLCNLAGLEIPASFRGLDLFDEKAHAARPDQALVETGIWFDNNKRSDLFFQHLRIDYPDITGMADVDFGYRVEMVLQQRWQNVITGAKHRTLYSGDWKLIYMPLADGVRYELYNHKDDPYNRNDLSAARPDELRRMQELLREKTLQYSNGNIRESGGYLLPNFCDPAF